MKKTPENFYVSFIREGVSDNIFELIQIKEEDLSGLKYGPYPPIYELASQ